VTRFVSADAVGGRPAARRPSFLGRVVDRGAITAAYVGIGMAVTMAISFLLVIPIEPVYWALSVPAGLLIGYYANARSARGRGHWPLIASNAIFSGLATGLTLAVLLLGVKALFFAVDDGYRDPSLGGPVTVEKDDGRPAACESGGGCVYQRYAEDQAAALRAAGVTDAATFSTFYWAQQWSTAGLLIALTTGFGLAGGVIYGVTRPRPKVVKPIA
jgi:hypothetical protein